MKDQTKNTAKLGAFIILAISFLILGLYYIGSKKNFFQSTINISSTFNSVNGLMQGNNIRFNGINVGTVTKVYAISDSLIKVEYTIDENLTKYINQDAMVSIGTDGLLGNKLINIHPGKVRAKPIKEGSKLKSLKPLQIDNGLRTLSITNDNLKIITDNLKSVTEKFNDNNSLWNLLSDPELSANVKSAFVRFKLTGTNSAEITGDLSEIVRDIKAGKGAVGALLTDTTFSNKLDQTIVSIQAISDSVAILSGNFSRISKNLEKGTETIANLVTDTMFVKNINQSLKNIKEGSEGFNENMKALKSSPLLRRYYKKVAGEEKEKSK